MSKSLKKNTFRKPPARIFFYLPSSDLVSKISKKKITRNNYWNLINNEIKKSPAKLPNDNSYCKYLGPYNWVIQTYLYLKAFNYKCSITSTLEINGIVITHGDFLPRDLKITKKRFIVEIKPDRSLSYLFSNFVITQNFRDPIMHGVRKLLIASSKIDYWPQPNIIKRKLTRKNLFKNIFYMGKSEQFFTRVDKLRSSLKKLNLNLKIPPTSEFHNYSTADLILAVREESSAKSKISRLSANKKPASKLINAWMAGVPAIVSPDSSYLNIKKSDLDFLIAKNRKEIIQQVKKLKNDPELRSKMIKNGKKRASEFNTQNITGQWVHKLQNEIFPRFLKWKKSPFYRICFLLTRLFMFPQKIVKYL